MFQTQVGLIRALLSNADGSKVALDFFPSSGKEKSSGGILSAMSTGLGIASAAVTCLTLGMSRYDSDLLFTPRKEKKKYIKYSGKRHVLLLPSVDLAFVKELKDKAGTKRGSRTTVNDVLFSATSGAIRRYCQLQGDPLVPGDGSGGGDENAGLQLRALMPVSFPRKVEIAVSCSAVNLHYLSCAH